MLKAPQVKHYISWLDRMEYARFDNVYCYDEPSYGKIDELFKLMERIEPSRKDRGIRELWLPVERGAIEDFGDYEELLEDEQVASREEFEDWWKSEYPEETEWFQLCTLDDKEIHYRAVFLNHRHVLEVDPRKKRDPVCAHDIYEFICWLVDTVKTVIEKLEAGTYNEEVKAKLPAKHRTGIITRQALWDLYPPERKELFQNLTQEDVDYFLQNAAEHPKKTNQRMKAMTANDFYSFCAMGYRENRYEGSTDLSPRELYDRYADGRDDGLSEIEPDSPEAFHAWLHDNNRRGGHPWEVCRGGNSTHVSLSVWDDENGYCLIVAGSAVTRTVEAIKFFLPLHRADLPVVILDAEPLKQRLLGTELVGVVPHGIIPAYCGSMFKEDVIDYMNLPFDDREAYAAQCRWYPLPAVRLIAEEKEKPNEQL